MTFDELTLQDFMDAKWQDVMSRAEIPDYMYYHGAYDKAARDSVAEGIERSAYAFVFLQRIASIHLRSDNPDEPFEPMGIADGRRSILPSDFSPHEINLIRELSAQCLYPEMTARLQDILWVVEKDHVSGKAAVDSYLASASNLRGQNYTFFNSKISRAVQLAAMLGGRNNTLLPKCKTLIDEIIGECYQSDNFSRALKLCDLLFTQRLEKVDILITHFQKISDTFIEKKRWHEAHWALGSLRKAHSRLHQEKQARIVHIRESEVYETEAGNFAAEDNYLTASDFLMRAINIKKNNGYSAEQLQPTYAKLDDYQRQSADNMKIFSSEIKVPEGVKSFYIIQHYARFFCN